MKKLLALALLLILASFTLTAHAELYPMTARVAELDYDQDIVIIEDFSGSLFSFYGCEDWQEGDCVSLIMDDNGTEKIFDDVIITAQYGGWELINWME